MTGSGVDSSSVGLTLSVWIVSSVSQMCLSLCKSIPPISISLSLSCFLSFFPFPTSLSSLSVCCKRSEVVVVRYRDFAQLVEMPVTTGWGWILLCCPFPRRRNCPLQPYGYQPFITFVRKGSDCRERETEYKLGFGPESTRFKPWLCSLLSK